MCTNGLLHGMRHGASASRLHITVFSPFFFFSIYESLKSKNVPVAPRRSQQETTKEENTKI